MERLFAYGTLRDPRILQEVIGRAVAGTPAVLDGYARSQMLVWREPYPILIRSWGRAVRGLLFLVSRRELGLLDRYEDRYRRARMALRGGQKAWVYLPASRRRLRAEERRVVGGKGRRGAHQEAWRDPS